MIRSPIRHLRVLAAGVAIALLPIAATLATAVIPAPAQAAQTARADHHPSGRLIPPPRPQGPCDIYAAAGTPCVAALSTTRALYASYNGPLYQVMRLSDGRTRNIGVVAPSAWPVPNPGGYANAAEQDAFCANTTCLITTIYDQSGHGNNLTQAPRGNFSGPAMGGADNLPVATMAPVTVDGHKVYGVYIEPGMGLRDDNTNGIATGNQPEGIYWVIDGHHYNNGCCFDFGNAEIDSHDDGDGTMETAYFGNAPYWYHGNPPGPWIMTDQENNLVGCANPGSTSTLCPTLPSITWRFVTGMVQGGSDNHWASLGGNAQRGTLATMFSGPRVNSTYNPMRKQGAIVLGDGGDNSNGAQGTFYEGVMTRGEPPAAAEAKVQANIVAAKYNVLGLSLTPASDTAAPPGLQTFTPGSSQESAVTFTNTTASREVGVKLNIAVPSRGWRSTVLGSGSGSKTFPSVAPGASVSATFKVTSGPAAFNGDLTAHASWTNPGRPGRQSETALEAVRNVAPVEINEFSAGTASNPTNGFIELYNSGGKTVDLSNWTLTEHPTAQAVSSTVRIPDGTTLASHGFYLLGLSSSGLAAPARAGAATINVGNTTGLAPGQQVRIGTGRAAEIRTITAVHSSGATGPRVAGKNGGGVYLNGDGEYIAMPPGIVSTLHDFTVSAWVNPSQNTPWSRIFDFGTGTSDYMFLTLSAGGGPLRFAITTSGNGHEQRLTAPSTLPLNTWSLVTVTLSGTTGTLYVNGQPAVTNTSMTLNPSSLGVTTNDWIGHSQFPADPYLNGTVSDFNIYSYALSASQVAALASGQPGAGNVVDYKFDEASGATVLDSSGNGNNGTIISPPPASTPLWQPLPNGPITIPPGSTNVPVTSTSGFTVGQKLAIGYGRKIDVATVTAVGTPGTQDYLAATAAAGSTNLKVTSTNDISVGDKIRLDIGPKTETVTVTSVGTPGATGTGLTLAAPLKFSHASNLPFADRGTGVTFSPATRFPHSSDEPVQPLDNAITLGKPLRRSYPVNTAVIDSAVKTAGYQGTPAPNLWFGGPDISPTAGSIVLRDAHGNVADSLNYGALVDPWAAEGYQGVSGSGAGGCYAPSPGLGSSDIRYPDGHNTDSNCDDFVTSSHPTPGGANQP